MALHAEDPAQFNSTSLISIICGSVACCNSLELVILICTTFHSYHSLYFWSLVVATLAIFLYVAGMEIALFDQSSKLCGLIINNVGWILMVVAQNVVLYSRLGIVLGDPKSRILVFTKWMIIIDAVIFYTLATVIVFGMHYSSNSRFAEGYVYVERLQMTGFCIQEFIISGLYIWKTLDILQAGEKKQAHRTLRQLFIVNVVIVLLDVALLVLEYLSLSSIEIAFKALVYSVKLKMEFAILNKLVESSNFARRSFSDSLSNTFFQEHTKSSSLTAKRLSQPQFITSALPYEVDNLRHAQESHVAQPQDIPASPMYRGRTVSELHPSQLHANTTYHTAFGRVPNDSYHDALKALSKNSSASNNGATPRSQN